MVGSGTTHDHNACGSRAFHNNSSSHRRFWLMAPATAAALAAHCGVGTDASCVPSMAIMLFTCQVFFPGAVEAAAVCVRIAASPRAMTVP